MSLGSGCGPCDRWRHRQRQIRPRNSPRAAVQLLIDRATAVVPDFTLSDANGPAIAEICRRLDGIPLAIELAAARMAAMQPKEVADHLDERFRLLTGGRRGAWTVRPGGEWDWSYSLLHERSVGHLSDSACSQEPSMPVPRNRWRQTMRPTASTSSTHLTISWLNQTRCLRPARTDRVERPRDSPIRASDASQ